MPQVLYSRAADGARPVLMQDDGSYLLDGELFRSSRKLVAKLTGHPEGRHWGAERYFGSLTPSPWGGDVLDLFGVSFTTPPGPLAPTLQAITFDTRVTVPRPPSRGLQTELVVAPRLPGIDLKNRGHEVAKLLFAGFGRRIHAAGYDPDDVLQQVHLGLLARNQGKCPWDPKKSSFGHYVHMVCGCVLANYHRKQRGVAEHEQVGMGGATEDGDWGVVDAAQAAVSPACPEKELSETGTDLLRYLSEHAPLMPKELELVGKVMPLLAAGYTRKEAAAMVGVSAPTVGRAFNLARPYVEHWRVTRRS